ncbi:MAG: hypothetical protein ABFD04_17055 [Syntrophomonas sp.]
MIKRYKKLIEALPLEACSNDLVSTVIEKSGIKQQVHQQAQAPSYGKDRWVYRVATLLMLFFLTGTAVFDLNKPEPVDPSQWSVNSLNLVSQLKQNAELLFGEGCVKK